MTVFATFAARFAMLLTALMLAVAMTACSDGTDDGPSGSVDRNSKEHSGNEADVTAAIEGAYRAVADFDAGRVCQRMTPAARRQLGGASVGQAGKDGGRRAGAGCARNLERILTAARGGGGLRRAGRVDVRAVEIDGESATATVRFGSQAAELPLREVDDEWKIGVVPALPSPASTSEPARRERG